MPQEAAGRGRAYRDSRDALHQQLPPKDLPRRPPAAIPPLHRSVFKQANKCPSPSMGSSRRHLAPSNEAAAQGFAPWRRKEGRWAAPWVLAGSRPPRERARRRCDAGYGGRRGVSLPRCLSADAPDRSEVADCQPRSGGRVPPL